MSQCSMTDALHPPSPLSPLCWPGLDQRSKETSQTTRATFFVLTDHQSFLEKNILFFHDSLGTRAFTPRSTKSEIHLATVSAGRDSSFLSHLSKIHEFAHVNNSHKKSIIFQKYARLSSPGL